MPIPLIMPKFEMTQRYGTIVEWLRHEGDWVEKGEPVLEVETDKVVMEVESPASGRLTQILATAGQKVAVTQVIANILQAGEVVSATSSNEKPVIEIMPQVKTRATPAARRTAREFGVDLKNIEGSGPHNRIQESDVRSQLPERVNLGAVRPPTKSTAVIEGKDEVIPLEGVRQTIAERLTKSYQSIPHVYFTIDVDMNSTEALRRSLNQQTDARKSQHISITALLVKVCAQTLMKHPLLNASLRDGEIHQFKSVDIGVAVALKDGLIVPVIHAANDLGLTEIAIRLNELTERAKGGKLTIEDIRGGTFTISNLGMFGIEEFTAIINPPQSAILAVGKLVKKLLVLERPSGDELVIRPLMKMTLGVDHRIVDGAVAANFLHDVTAVLENPDLIER